MGHLLLLLSFFLSFFFFIFSLLLLLLLLFLVEHIHTHQDQLNWLMVLALESYTLSLSTNSSLESFT
jgi:hypothetical protein